MILVASYLPRIQLVASYPPRIQLTVPNKTTGTLRVDTERYPIDDREYLLNESGEILVDEKSEFLIA